MKEKKDFLLSTIKKLGSIPQAFLVVLNSPINKAELNEENKNLNGFFFGDLAKI